MYSNQSPVQHTVLWQRLSSGFTNSSDASVAQDLAASVSSLCAEAANRMRGFPSLHAQYTLHDEVHLLRVTELMARVMPPEVLQNLNPVEIALLILAAHFHDQGMVPDSDEIARWKEDSPNPDSAFVLFRQNWAIEHLNLEAARRQINDPALDEQERSVYRRVESDLLDAMLSDYLRQTHGERAATWLKAKYSQDARLLVQSASLTNALARLCQSHVGPVSALTEANAFRVDERIGIYSVNLVYLALILRLADILDFDRERTPDSLYRTIDFRSPISLAEWGKHRAVVGWDISPDAVQFTMECEHPEYERAAKRFMDYIDEELQNATQRIREFPKRAAHYKLDLPVKTDRSRIRPKNNDYIYHDLEFSLSRDEVVKLLMTDKLYGSPSLCVRELLQNSLDALRHRTALFKRTGVEWQDGKVQMFHEVDAHGHEIVRCVDNGIGMTRDIVLNFLTTAGRSYYRSPQFEQERIGLRAAGVDFDPCAQFGIGFMSVFMLGDHVVIHTRRDNGPASGHGEPLVVEINGLGGIVVLRSGKLKQPVGTTITITGRKKPRFINEWNDKVQLISVLAHFALATEFPIEASCKIKSLEESIIIPSVYAKPSTAMETANLKKIITVEQQFNEIHPSLGGCMRASFIVDEKGDFSLSNDEANWKMMDDPGLGIEPELIIANASENNYTLLKTKQYRGSNAITLDGILITGEGDREIVGRDSIKRHLLHVTRYGSGGNGILVYLLDVRNSIKPPITPAREPISARAFSDNSPRWNFIYTLIRHAKGRLWEQMAELLNARANPELFWQLNIIYSKGVPSFSNMRATAIWQNLSMPVTNDSGNQRWVRVNELGYVSIVPEKSTIEQDASQKSDFEEYSLFTSANECISSYEALTHWGDYKDKRGQKSEHANPRKIDAAIKFIISTISNLTLCEGKPILEVRSPESIDRLPSDSVFLTGSPFEQNVLTLLYTGSASTFFSILSPLRTANQQHPLVQLALATQYKENLSELEEFSVRLISCLSKPRSVQCLLSSSKKDAHWFKELGARFVDLNRSQIPKKYLPPYMVRLIDGTSVQISEEVFEGWANAEV